MPLPAKSRSKTSTAWKQPTTDELLQECADDDSLWQKPRPTTQSPDSESESALGGTTSSSEGEAISPDVPFLVNPIDPSSAPDRLHLSRANSQVQYDQQRLCENLASFRDTLVSNHLACLSMLDQELEKVKNGLALAGAAAGTSSALLTSGTGKSVSKRSMGSKEVRVQLPGALGTSSETLQGAGGMELIVIVDILVYIHLKEYKYSYNYIVIHTYKHNITLHNIHIHIICIYICIFIFIYIHIHIQYTYI